MIERTTRLLLTPPPSTSRIVELDALRGIAALGVVFYHYTLRYDQIYGHTSPLPITVSAGRYGVLLFFMISGFVILMSLEHTKRIQDFVVKRVVRLYPTYWVAIALTFSLVAVLGLPGREVSASDAVLNSLMVHPFWGIPNVDGVYWTLLIELIFYIVMVGVCLLRLLPHIEWVVMVWLGINTLENHNLLIEIPEQFERWFILDYGYLFMMGIIFYRVWQHGGSVVRYGLIAACFASQMALYPEIERHITVLICLVMFALINGGKLRAIAIPPLLALGSVSYSLYLIHQNIGYIIIRSLESVGVSPVSSIIVAISLTIALAAVITRYIEQPTFNWIKQIYRPAK